MLNQKLLGRGVTQLVERRSSNRKFAKLVSTPDVAARCSVLVVAQPEKRHANKTVQ